MLIRLVRQILQNEAVPQSKRHVRARHVPLLFQAPSTVVQERLIPADNKDIRTAREQTTAGDQLQEKPARISHLSRLIPTIAGIPDSNRGRCNPPIKAAPAEAGPSAPSPPRKAVPRPKARIPRLHVPLLFGPHLDGMEEATASTDLQCPTTLPESIAADTSQIALVPPEVATAPATPGTLKKSPLPIDVPPPPACTPTIRKTGHVQPDRNTEPTENRPRNRPSENRGNLSAQTDVAPAPAAPVRPVPSPFQLDVGSAPACAATVLHSNDLRIDEHGDASEKRPCERGGGFTRETETFELSVSTLIDWVANFPTGDAGIEPAKRNRRRSGPLYYRPSVEALEDRLVPANISSVKTGFWNDPTVWGGAVPTSADNVTITNGLTVTLNTPASGSNIAASLTINNGGTLAGGTNQSLTIHAGGNNAWVDNGTFTANTSTIIFDGSASQRIDAADTFYNLQINNSSSGGVTNHASGLTVSHTLTLTNGAFGIGSTGGEQPITLGNGATIIVVAGSVDAVPGFGTSVNVTYSNTTPITTGLELPPSSGTVLNNLTVNGSSTVTLKANTNAAVQGNLTVSSGSLILGTDTANGLSTGTLAVGSGATLDVGGANNFPSGYGTVNLDAASTVVYNGAISQTVAAQTYGNLTVSGGSTGQLAGNTTVSGTLTLNSSTDTLDLNGHNASVASLSGGVSTSGTVTNNGAAASTLTVTETSDDTFGGTLSDGSKSLALTQSGTANLTLTGTNTFSGATTVNSGTLTVNGSDASSQVDLVGGTLGGTGTVGVIDATGGTIDPSDTGGTAKLTSSDTGASTINGATYSVNLDASQTQTSDELVIGGSIDLTGGTLAVTLAHSAPGDVFTIISGTIANNSTFSKLKLGATTTNGLSDGTTFTLGGDTFVIHYTTSAVTLADVQAATITSVNNTLFTVGSSGSFTVQTSGGVPTPALTKSGSLPGGVTFTDNHDGTATISGIPAAGTANTYPITITADNGIPVSQPFTLTVQKATPTFTTAPTPTTVTLGAAAVTLTDAATLTGVDTPTGTITFTLTGPNNTVVDTETVTVSSGNGTYTTPTGFSTTVAGTYQWTATYTGDSNNSAANDG